MGSLSAYASKVRDAYEEMKKCLDQPTSLGKSSLCSQEASALTEKELFGLTFGCPGR